MSPRRKIIRPTKITAEIKKLKYALSYLGVKLFFSDTPISSTHWLIFRNEFWKDIPGFKNCYQASTLGRIKSLGRFTERSGYPVFVNEMIRSGVVDQKVGYINLTLRKNGKYIAKGVHHLVCLTFLDNPECKRTTNHKNGDVKNNAIWNLEWMTHSENHKHAYEVLNRTPPMKGRLGKNNKKSMPVVKISKGGQFIEKFNGISEAVRNTPKTSSSSISKVCKGQLKSCGGYKWEYYKK